MTPDHDADSATVDAMSEQPHPDRVRLLPWIVPDRLIDAALVAMVTIGFLVRPTVEDTRYEAADWVAFALAVALLLTRRRFPRETLAVAVVAAAVNVGLTDRPPALLPVALIALFTVASHDRRAVAVVAGLTTTASFVLMITVLLRRNAIDGASLAAVAWPAFAAAAGTAVRAARENIAVAEERALRAEEARELHAKQRVIEERLRIARDVHDLVAHHIAVINVQSGVAGHLIQSNPAAATAALGEVRGAASTVVEQLGELLGVLRSPDDDDQDSALAPTVGLEAIDDLISSFSSSGLDIREERTGRPREMSESAEVAAYRVVQEALTNAHKHGDGRAIVGLRYDDGGLHITVSNATSEREHPTDGLGTGFGLVGMRERVESVGGHLVTGPNDAGDGFELHAHIPRKALS